jgi:hypothetical protein
MNIPQNRSPKTAIIIIFVVAAALVSAFFALENTSQPVFEPRPVHLMPFGFGYNFTFVPSSDVALYYSSSDYEFYYLAKTILSTVNATLLVFLLVTYIDIYRKLKSEFTGGLIIFSLTLLIYAFVSNPLMQSVFGFRGVGLGPFAMLPDLFTFLSLCVLLYLTMK